MPTISLCMIAKNEGQWISQCITSVKPIIDEIIVVDTGSSDQTIDIVKSLGGIVLEHPWDDDFSSPRNMSLEQATSDWILVLDADEAIAESDHAELQRLVLDKSRCYEFLQRHYSNDHRNSSYCPVQHQYPKWEKGFSGYFTSNCVRLFPNHEGINFRGKVHELVEHSIYEIGHLNIIRTHIPIHHYGHTALVTKDRNKSAIYQPLGEAKVCEAQGSWKNHFEMGVQYNIDALYQQSVDAFRKAASLCATYVPIWVNLGYVLGEMGEYADAKSALARALKLDITNSEAHCNMGVIMMRSKDFPLAVKHFKQAIHINPSYVNALCNLGKAFTFMNQLSEAAYAYDRALELMPRCGTAKLDLGAIYLSVNEFEESERLFQEVADEMPHLIEVYYYLGTLYKELNQVTNAIKAFDKFCALVAETNTVQSQSIVTTEMFSRAESARKFLLLKIEQESH